MVSQSTYLIFTPDAITPAACTALIDQVQALIAAGVTSITILISSPGGNVYAGILAYNFLKGVPVEIVTHNINVCDSISAIIYAAGARRLSVPHGRFLLHGVMAGFPAGANLSEVQLEERLSTMKNDAANIAGVLAAVTGKTEAAIHEDMRQVTTLDPQQAVDYGLVHEIQEALYSAGAAVIRVTEPPRPAAPTTSP